MDAGIAKENTRKYLFKCDPKLRDIDEEFPRLQQNLLLTNLFNDKQDELIFKSKILMNYFAASYIVSCLISKNLNPTHLFNRVRHGWDISEISLEDFIKKLRSEKNSILKIIHDELQASESFDHALEEFCKLIDKVYVPKIKCKRLKEKINNLPGGFEFELIRSQDQIKIIPKLNNVTESLRIRTVITIMCNLQDILQDLNVKDVDFIENDEATELTIKFQNQVSLNAVAEILQISSGTKLSHYASIHAFFCGVKEQHQPDASARCSIM